MCIKVKMDFYTFRPHIANFAWEASPGTMAGLVPQNSLNKGSTEVIDKIGRVH